MIRTYNNGRKYETTAKSVVSEDYPELITLVTITEDGKDFDAYRTEHTPEEVYAKLRWLYRCEDYEEITD